MQNLTIGKKLISVKYVDEVNVYIDSDEAIQREINGYFKFRVPNYEMLRRQNPRLFYWDGYKHLYNSRKQHLPYGLLEKLYGFCKERKYKLTLDPKILANKNNVSKKEFKSFIDGLDLPFEPRDYQLEATHNSINKKHLTIESPTASGKSFFLYMFTRWCLEKTKGKVLIIVPTITLTSQMASDFVDYGFKDHVHSISGGVDKDDNNSMVYCSTWQSLVDMKEKYFDKFETVILDEVHICASDDATVKKIQKILANITKAHYRIGCTGTLRDGKLNRLQVIGMFGTIFKATGTKELMDRGLLAKLNIKSIFINYPKEIISEVRKLDWQQQLEFMESVDNPRQQLVVDVAKSQTKNTLVLFRKIEQGRYIEEQLIAKTSKKVYYVDGSVKSTEREDIRKKMEIENNAILVASFGTFSVGCNVKNLHCVIYASSSKSKIRVLQSLGRGLRVHGEESVTTLIDFIDNFGHFAKHYKERKSYYDSEQFQIKEIEIELVKWCNKKNINFF